jgi:hypothetical protein
MVYRSENFFFLQLNLYLARSPLDNAFTYPIDLSDLRLNCFSKVCIEIELRDRRDKDRIIWNNQGMAESFKTKKAK